MSSLDLFHHLWVDNGKEETLCLLHGTGGDEYDLLGIGQLVSARYNLLSLRGNVLEIGMNRFFRRSAPGVFDRGSIDEETGKLAEFVEGWNEEHGRIDAWLGYSNGANMILAMWFLYPALVKKAVLLHGMLPLEPTVERLDGEALVTYGAQDVMIPRDDSVRMKEQLEKLGVSVSAREYSGGHEITREELGDVVGWLG